MEYINVLKEVRNNLKLLNNYNNIEYARLTDSFDKFQIEINELEDLLVDLNEECHSDLKLLLMSIVGSILPIIKNNDNDVAFLVVFSILFIYSAFNYIKDQKEYKSTFQMYDETDEAIFLVQEDAKIIKNKQEKMEKEIKKIDIGIEFLNGLTKEEEEKYLSYKM